MTAIALLKHQSKVLHGSMVMPLVCDQGQSFFIAVCASVEYSCKPVVFVKVLSVLRALARAGKQGKATRTFRRSIRSGKRGSWKEPGLPAASFSVLTWKTPWFSIWLKKIKKCNTELSKSYSSKAVLLFPIDKVFFILCFLISPFHLF